MKQLFVLTVTGALSFIVGGCKTRGFGGEFKGVLENAKDSGILPFNALQMLQNEKESPILEYPKNYKGNWNIVLGPNGDGIREVRSDGVFFSSHKDWFTIMPSNSQSPGGGADRGDGVRAPVNEGGLGSKTIELPTAEPTTYAKVSGTVAGDRKSGGVLTYELEGRVLSIRFTELQDKGTLKTHAEAIEHCAAKKLRLPTARELFDFCTAGIEPKLLPERNIKTWAFVHRCMNVDNVWSLTLRANNLGEAWVNAGWPRTTGRTQKNPFYCVGYANAPKSNR